jgi:hypothetical protein
MAFRSGAWIVFDTVIDISAISTSEAFMIITLSPSIPVNLYSATGIAVGTQLHVQNITGNRIRLSTSQTGLLDNYNVVDNTTPWVNKSSDTGGWVICGIGYCDINVRAA